jgi:outer membrane protein OmpA-like peptidoglycan-associated protein
MKTSSAKLIGLLCGFLIAHKVSSQQIPEIGTGLPIKIAEQVDISVEGEQLNHLVNTPYRELGPMPTKDGKRLYFSRQGHPDNTGGEVDEDIWYCEFDDGTQSWTKAINIGPPLNSIGPNFITGIGLYGDTLLLANVYGKNGKMSSGVSVSVKVGNLWSFPVPVKIQGDYNFAGKASYDLSHDRNTLIIAQQKIDSYGKLDLYVAFRDPDSGYPYAGRESINLGSVINTSGNETSPWLAYDGRTLYFASDGHNGYGGYDIFMSKRLDHTWTHWSEPVNMGPGINSPFDDMSFNYNPNNRYAYFARGLTADNTDIYRIDMTYLFKNTDSALEAFGNDINSVEMGQTEIVRSVFHDDKSTILEEATPDLNQIVNFLKKNSDVLILVSTHSNQHATRRESLLLSNQRAINVVDFLVKNGINRNRLTFQGFGHDIVVNSKPSSLAPSNNIASIVEFKFVGFEKPRK